MLVFASPCCILFRFDRIDISSKLNLYIQFMLWLKVSCQVFLTCPRKSTAPEYLPSYNSTIICVLTLYRNICYHHHAHFCFALPLFWFGRIGSRFRSPQKHGNQPPRCRIMRGTLMCQYRYHRSVLSTPTPKADRN